MKNAFISMVLGVVLCAFVFCLIGCAPQLGQTGAQVRRKHLRNARINRQELMEDIDKALLIDKPSKLTGKRIP